jgi:exopolysaccharide biosynthesis polyprenyl glycosylphosphotransferase
MRNVLIVGTGKRAREVAAHLEQYPGLGRAVRGFLAEDGPVGGGVLGTVEDLSRVALAEFVDEVLLAIPERRDLAQRVIREARLNRLDVKIVPDLFGFQTRPTTLENFGNVPVLTLYEEPIPAFGLCLKRAVDVVGSAMGLAALTPVLATIALAIKLDSAGPVLYRAPRVGRKGRRFLCSKFRTMITDADKLKAELRASNEREGPFFKIADDPRITRVGRLLRRYSLDEIPQLWNVLRGEMSLVGPRPHPLDDFEHYDLEDLRRLDVTPGITGLWQVTARRDPSFARNMALDLEYIEGWNLWMDLRILYQTVSVVLEGSGA